MSNSWLVQAVLTVLILSGAASVVWLSGVLERKIRPDRSAPPHEQVK